MSESGTKVGNWTMIGYKMANTTSFNYDQGDLSTTSTALEGLTATSGWVATNQAKLNDCPSQQTWTINVAENTGTDASSSPVKYTVAYSDETNCAALTPSFGKLAN